MGAVTEAVIGVSRIRSHSTWATVRPTSHASQPRPAWAARAAGPSGARVSPSGVRMASGPISGPLARSTARCRVFSSSRTLPRQGS